MKTKSTLILAGIFIAGALFVTVRLSNNESAKTTHSQAPAIRKAARPPSHQASMPEPDAREREKAETSPVAETEFDEEANLAGWQRRFHALLEEKGNREEAVAAILAEVDGVFGAWVGGRLASLGSLPPGERYDPLASIDESVRGGAAAIVELLEIQGGDHVSIAAGALEAVEAEMHYAEAAPDSASRLAMLRLDKERQERLDGLMSIVDEAAMTRAMDELNQWYETGLAKVFSDDAEDGEMH